MSNSWEAENPYDAMVTEALFSSRVLVLKLERAAFDRGCIAQAKALIADIDMELMDFISAVILFTDSGELRKLAFEFKTYWQQLKQEVGE